MTSDGAGKRAYLCRQCHDRKFIPGRDGELERTIRTGCQQCGTITTHKKQGVATLGDVQ